VLVTATVRDLASHHDEEDGRLIRAIHVKVDLTSRIDATDVAGKEASKLAL